MSEKAWEGDDFKALVRYLRDNPTQIIQLHPGAWDREAILAVSAELKELRAQLCRAREAAIPWHQQSDELINALSSPSPCPHEKEAKRLREISKALALKALTVSAVSAYLVEAVEAAKRYREIVGIGRKPEDGAMRAIEEFDDRYLAYREMMEKSKEEGK